MKKILSTLLALVLVLSLATVAFADVVVTPTDPSTPTTLTDMSTVTLVKEYKLTNAGTTSPAEVFEFSTLTCTSVTDAAEGVTAKNAPVPTIASVSYSGGEAGGENAKKEITLTLPTYNSVGIYTYTFTENDGNTAGVTYRSEDITLKVTVIEQNGKVRVAAVHTEKEGNKSGTFDNIYSAGSLTVTKKVTGLLGDTSKKFSIKVKFTAPSGDTVKSDISYNGNQTITAGENGWSDSKEVTINLANDETCTFSNIPYGVTYEVVEDDYTGDNGGYDDASYDNNKTGTINSDSVSTTITNNKGGTVDTGITLDSMPYFVILSVACVGMFLLLTKKRATREF